LFPDCFHHLRAKIRIHPRLTKRIPPPIHRKNPGPFAILCPWPGYAANQVPPANQNAFKHGLAGITQRRINGALTSDEQTLRADILAGLIADKGGEQRIGTAERILAEIISSDVALLVTFNQAIDGVLKNNQKARQNPKALAQLDSTSAG
jgi:hypothetical protein